MFSDIYYRYGITKYVLFTQYRFIEHYKNFNVISVKLRVENPSVYF